MSRALIANPAASGVDEERIAAVQRVLGRDVDLHLTEKRGHARDLARELSTGTDVIYVFSGDGTFNEVLNGVEHETALGFLPGGGTSVLSRALGLPRDPVRAALRLLTGAPRRIGLGRANGRRFGFSAGVGFDAQLVRRVDELGRAADGKRPGDAAFAGQAARMLVDARFRFEPVLEVAGMGRAVFALVANCSPYTYLGSLPLKIAPEARFELGLDLVAPREVWPGSLPRLAWYALRGNGQQRASDLLYRHDADRISIVADAPIALQLDGEDVGDVERLELEAERDAVTVIV